MKQPELGKLCDAAAERDAVHLALYPCVAGERLNPGQRVGVSKVTGHALAAAKWVGVVDPFLDRAVEPGEKFYICVRPGEVTGLRHVYTHPAFDGGEATVTTRELTPQEAEAIKKGAVKMTIREFEEALYAGTLDPEMAIEIIEGDRRE